MAEADVESEGAHAECLDKSVVDALKSEGVWVLAIGV